MNLNRDQQSSSAPERLKIALGWIAFVFSALAVSVEVFLHRSRSFGDRYIGFQAGAVLLIVPLYSMFWEGHDLRPLLCFMGLFLLMCFFARLGGIFRSQQGPRGHSRYTGTPRLMRILPNVNEITVKRGIEPFIVFFGGALTLGYSQPLGSWLMFAGFGLFASVHLSLGYQAEQARELHDAYLEQRDLADEVRRMR